MKVSFRILVVLVIGTIALSVNGDAEATSGALKQASIKTCADGVTYGQHGDDNHWHAAEKSNTKSGWSAIGSPLAGDPCPGGGGTSANGSASQSNSAVAPTPAVTTAAMTVNEVKSSDNSIKSISVNDAEVPEIKEEMEATVKVKRAIIEVQLNDNKAAYTIDGWEDGDTLGVGEVVEAKIKVTAENGDERGYKLSVKRVAAEGIARLTALTVNGQKVSKVERQMEVMVANKEEKLGIQHTLGSEGAKLKIMRGEELIESEKAELSEGNNEFRLVVEDNDGNDYTYYLTVKRKSSGEEIGSALLGMVVLGGGGYGAYRLAGKKKKKR